MIDYIRRDEILEKQKMLYEMQYVTELVTIVDIPAVRVSDIESISAADVRPVVYGEWEQQENGTWVCSKCKSWIPDEQHFYAMFCLHCGADMTKGANNE